MKKKIVLFFPRLEESKDYHWFPLSTLSIAAPLIAKGYECRIVDERITPDYRQRLIGELADAVCLGISSLTGFQLHGALEAAKLARLHFPEIRIVWGGPHVSNLPEQSLRSRFVDFIVRGYGEAAFLELVEALCRGRDFTKIPGLGYKQKKTTGLNEIKFERDELRYRLPYELLDLDRYINPETQSAIYVSSYGCPALCTFCSTPHTRRWLPLDLQKVRNDIEYLLSLHSFKRLSVYDATLFAKEERAFQILALLKEYGLSWGCDARAAELYRLQDKSWAKLVGSGLQSMTVGLESGSPRILKIMRKGDNHLMKFKKTLLKANEFGIPICSGVVFGIPSETTEDLKRTFDFISEMRGLHRNFTISSTFFSPLPGTGLFASLEADYAFKYPDSLEAWSEWGTKNHYLYNQYVEVPWLGNTDRDRYHRIYDENMRIHQDIIR